MIEIEEIEHRWNESKRLISLLVLLEYEYPAVLDKVANTKINNETIQELIFYALEFDSRHWAEKAVIWIEADFPINNRICDKLLLISEQKSDSQNLRHRSLKQAKRWQHANAT